MTMSKAFRKEHKNKKPQANRKANTALVFVLVALGCATLVHAYIVIARATLRQFALDHAHHISHLPPVQPVKVTKLRNEKDFQKTIRSCLPSLSKNCQTHVPDDGVPRVAILAPPGDFGNWIFQWVQRAVDASPLGSSVHMHLDLVSHIPPYGYGKTHGWTKLIRVVPRSLMLGAADAIRGTLELGETQTSLTLKDLKAALRMLLRWHCRISHVAAHTAVLTLEMDTVSRAPMVATQGLLGFLNITARAHGEGGEEDIEGQEDSEDVGGAYMARAEVINGVETSNQLDSYASSLLTWIERHESTFVGDELNGVLKEEMGRSNQFKDWPCESFWSADEGTWSKFTTKLAKSLSPDCSGPHTQCTVEKDRCEERGNPKCK